MSVRLRLLGSPALDGRPLPPGRGTELIAALAEAGDRGVSVTGLIELLWRDNLPEHPRKSLQILVSRLRSQAVDVIERSGSGYRISIAAEQVDVMAAAAAARAASEALRVDDLVTAKDRAQHALELWSHATTSTDGDGVLDTLIADHQADRHGALRTLGLAVARSGLHAAAAPALEAAAAADPWDQEVRLELIRGVAAGAGSAAALEMLEKFRRRLRDQLGLDIGPELGRLQAALLRDGQPVTRVGLRHPASDLLGRDDDVHALLSLLEHRRLVSVVGPGGLGKTTLAHVVGAAVHTSAVVFVPLAGASGSAATITEIRTVLGVRDPRPSRLPVPGTPTPDPVTHAVAALGAGALLILDNCEHLLDDVASTVTDLLAASPDLRIMITSRAALGLPGEAVHLLPELDLPTSVSLFTQLARDAGASVGSWSDDDRTTTRRLCSRLDGLPLAVELAAARITVLSVEQIDQRLSDRIMLLRNASRTAPARHRTLEAVIDWSWQLLDPAQQRALGVLSGFVDGFTLAAAEKVLRQLLPGIEPVELVEHLVTQSMIVGPGRTTTSRFRILETVREFAAGRAPVPGHDVRAAIVRWAADSSDRAPELFGSDPFDVIDQARAEQDNLVAALRWAIEDRDVFAVQRIFLVLSALWLIDSAISRAAAFTEPVFGVVFPALPEPGLLDDEDERRLRAVLTMIALSSMGTSTRAGIRSVVALRRRPVPEVTNWLDAVTVVLPSTTDPRDVTGADACEDPGRQHPLVLAATAMMAGQWWENVGDPDRTLAMTRLALEALPDAASPWLTAMAQARLGEVLMQMGSFEEAAPHLREAWPVLERIGAHGDVWQIRLGIALGHLHAGQLSSAEEIVQAEGSDTTDDLGLMQPFVDAVRADLLVARGDIEAGLERWRRSRREALARVDHRLESGLEPWALTAEALCVIAHVRQGAGAAITDEAESLRNKLFQVVLRSRSPKAVSVFSGVDVPVTGAVARAVGLHLLPTEPDLAVRLLALAELMSPSRMWPLLSGDRAEQDARRVAGTLFDLARAQYEGLTPHQAVDALRDLAAAHS